MFFRVILLLLLFPANAVASETCMPADEMEATLIDWYGEHPAEETSPNVVLWLSGAGESWTLVAYKSNGTACTIEHGSGWTNHGRHVVNVQEVSSR